MEDEEGGGRRDKIYEVDQAAVQLGMSEKREYAISAYLALCRIFAYFSKVRISHIFPHILAFRQH